MAERRSSSGFWWIFLLMPLCSSIGRAISGLDHRARGDAAVTLIVVATVVAVVGLCFARMRSESSRPRRTPPRPTTPRRPVHLDPLWDDQLDRYPR
jgi:hypothetical protein